MGLLSSLKAFFNRPRRRHARRPADLPDGAHANATRLPSGRGEGGGGEPPEWLRIVPLGAFPEHHDGAHEVTEEHLSEMVASFEQRSTDILVDFDHASVFDGDTRAAAWISEVEKRKDGLYGRITDWTPAGEEAFANRDFRYLSPVYFLDSEDKQGDAAGAFVHSVALTNLPYFNEGEVDGIGNTSGVGAPSDDDSHDDDPNPSSSNDSDFMDRDELIDKLGLDEDATDEEIDEALEALGGGDDEEGEPSGPEDEETSAEGEEGETASDDAAEDGDADEEDLEAKINAAVEKRLAERDGEQRAQALVDGAVEDGKILPAQKGIYLNSARADFEATKKQLDGIDEGAATPSGVKVNTGGGPSQPRGGSKMLEYVQSQQAS